MCERPSVRTQAQSPLFPSCANMCSACCCRGIRGIWSWSLLSRGSMRVDVCASGCTSQVYMQQLSCNAHVIRERRASLHALHVLQLHVREIEWEGSLGLCDATERERERERETGKEKCCRTVTMTLSPASGPWRAFACTRRWTCQQDTGQQRKRQ